MLTRVGQEKTPTCVEAGLAGGTRAIIALVMEGQGQVDDIWTAPEPVAVAAANTVLNGVQLERVHGVGAVLVQGVLLKISAVVLTVDGREPAGVGRAACCVGGRARYGGDGDSVGGMRRALVGDGGRARAMGMVVHARRGDGTGVVAGRLVGERYGRIVKEKLGPVCAAKTRARAGKENVEFVHVDSVGADEIT